MDENNWVVKSNALTEAKGSFTPLELKVLLAIISEIRLDDKDLKEFDLSVEGMKKLLERDSNSFYDELKNACKRLVSRTHTVEREIDSKDPRKLKKKKSFEIMNYLSYATYVEGESRIKIAINPYFKPYLIDLQGSFTKYQLKYALELNSVHAIRIYELTKPMKDTSHQKRKILLKDLRSFLGIEEKEYSRFFDFEKYVLKVAEKEISEHTDIVLTYEKIKKGKPIHAIEFHVKTKEYVRTEEQTEKKAFYDEVGTESAPLIREKVGLPVTINNAQVMELYEIASSMTEDLNHIDRFEYMRENYIYTLEQKYKSLFGYYKNALQNDYAKACENKAKEMGLYEN